MKTQHPNLKIYAEKLNTRNTIILSTVGFQGSQTVDLANSKRLATDFLEEFKEAINSGDESLWRMWR
ncbi:hypothetical protein [Pedobacter sp. UYP1]|jgi:hypothetical protein|uniref:hypothetical protein n=1 Tax=Pedobacter sp. UYP1 TaxID=1756396 RepID=UPI003396E3B0